MKKVILAIGIILILLGLEIAITQQVKLVTLVYLFAGSTLIAYGRAYDKVTKLIHITISVLYAIPIIIIGFIAIYGSIHTTDFNEDVVFVLGAGLENDEILKPLEARLNQALIYFENNADAMFIVCGGYGEGQTISEAQAMADYLIAGGIADAQIILEDLSTSTYENFSFALTLLEEYFPNGFSSVVITNNFHMYRSVYLAHHFGVMPSRFSARTPIQTWHRNYIRESMALFNTWLFQT